MKKMNENKHMKKNINKIINMKNSKKKDVTASGSKENKQLYGKS